ncbi:MULTISPECIES: TIGR03086 family metal-binding protein [Mycobacteriaceae]|uniref:TIGR03086 family metal-binding protein n=1 Tax=Mycolicibacterium parafortuitum TaxID=39692 RepID=A0ACC6MBA1_MYCPF|nr:MULTISPECIES: TIGR03086 family metal-binding protein [Mycobacteriaceae]MDZ5084197.1 TIGR03086 family metal-binding protein [Mycolicibacterium parafortuitum]GFM20547.1 TIGR03086 family protein [Mycobacterium sp. PO1]GFM22673.1 TIGR03086 family protein [Mycobacterium sp. PO2]
MIDMTPACLTTAGLLTALDDGRLSDPTPCRDMDIAALLAHLGGLSLAFTAAAGKQFGELTDTGPTPDADWRTSYPGRLAALGASWADPAAWTGTTRAAGIDFPAEVCGLIALTEVVVHGWDLARAARLAYDVPPALLAAILPHVASFAEDPVEGLFDAPRPVADDAPALTRVVALTGRDPHWQPPR